MTEAQEEKLLALLDEKTIRELLARYCRGVDRCDSALIASCFHPDARDDHGNWLSRGDEVADHIVGLVKPGSARAMHFMGNILIEIDGDVAYSEAYVLAYRAFERGGQAYTRTRALRFVDRHERRDNVWRISERVVVDEWNRLDAVLEQQDSSHLFRFSAKDTSDPVYAIREGNVARRHLD
ncbi:nuclear transport factor 2 family protein [Paraburkholderia aromaticivorans]|uniref:nuclear transport factor 2 family protein n=1 Tax=Paraburkholderia aromaticivorans TaxID=2026199 RepID=UPI001455FDE5|nr:nuclear transport factor 2 family protein [Paraburkholderia aromaticivorans]